MPGSPSYIAGMSQTETLTADQLLRLRLPGKQTELLRGVLVVREPAGYRHGRIAARLAKILMDHVDDGDLGCVLAAETGFKLASDPDTVRAPDIAFIRRERLPEPPPTAYAELAPDIAVEVLSPGDQPGEVLAKVADWLSAGSRLVWVVDPERRQARVYRADGSESLATEDGALYGEDVIPGFTCTLEAIF
jgi:Uma2 family endonuclease